MKSIRKGLLRRLPALVLFLSCALPLQAQYDKDHFYLSGRQAIIDGRYGDAI